MTRLSRLVFCSRTVQDTDQEVNQTDRVLAQIGFAFMLRYAMVQISQPSVLGARLSLQS